MSELPSYKTIPSLDRRQSFVSVAESVSPEFSHFFLLFSIHYLLYNSLCPLMRTQTLRNSEKEKCIAFMEVTCSVFINQGKNLLPNSVQALSYLQINWDFHQKWWTAGSWIAISEQFCVCFAGMLVMLTMFQEKFSWMCFGENGN